MPYCAFCGQPTQGKNRVCDDADCRKHFRSSTREGAIVTPDGYLTTAQFAKRRNISVQIVARHCRQGKYRGAIQDPLSGRWFVPEETRHDRALAQPHAIERRTRRRFTASDREWNKIVELAARTKYTVTEYILRKALNKPCEPIE
jgi:hypothetical protein